MTARCRRAPNLRDDRGQTSSEYVGALVLVVVLASALSLLVGTGVGEAVLRGTSTGICKVVEAAGLDGGGCAAAPVAAPAEDFVPDDCVVSSGESQVSGAVTVFSVRVGGDAAYVLEEKSDGNWYLTLKGGVNGGAEGAFGASGGSGSADVGGGAAGSAYIVAKGEGAVTYKFDSREAAEAELAEIERDLTGTPVRAAEGYLEGSYWDPPGPIPDVVPVPFGGVVGSVQKATQPEGTRPPAHETSYAAGIEGSVAGSAGAGAYADGSATAANVVGVTFGTDDDGRATQKVFYKVDMTGEGSAGLAFAGGFSGTGNGSAQVAVTFTEGDDGWDATSLTLEQAMGLSGGVDFAGTADGLEALQRSLKEVSIGASDEVGLAGVMTASYDLTDPATRSALADALVTVGIPALGPGSVDPLAAGRSVYDAFQTYDDLSFVTYDTTKSTASAGFVAGDLIAFGAEGSYTRKDSTLRNARYLTPDGWQDWVSCTG